MGDQLSGPRERVLIAGGGIGGLSATIALSRVGIESAVFERERVPREVGAGLCLWHNAMHVAGRLGLAEALADVGAPLEHQENRGSDGTVFESHSFAALARELGTPAVTIQRSELRAVLLANVPAGALRLGANCTAFEHDLEGVTCELAGGEREHGGSLVGADGITSLVRERLLGKEVPRYAGYTCCRGLVPYEPRWLPYGWFVQWIGPGARFGACHTGKGRLYWWATFNAPERSPDAPVGRKRELLERYAKFAAPVREILDATGEAAILRNDIIDRPPVRHWGEGRVTLLGDAAHPMTPNMAQGACQALEDSLILADALAATALVEPALRAYESRRIERTALVVDQSWLIGARGQGLLSDAERQAAMQLADREAVLRYRAG